MDLVVKWEGVKSVSSSPTSPSFCSRPLPPPLLPFSPPFPPLLLPFPPCFSSSARGREGSSPRGLLFSPRGVRM